MTEQPFNYEGEDLDSMSFASRYHRWIIDMFRPYLGRHACEVGAGCGNFSNFLMDNVRFDSFNAVEPSEEMYPRLLDAFAGKDNVEARKGYFRDHAAGLKGRIDTAVYVNVMEHVEKDLDEMKAVFETLPSGGHLCIFVPALQFLMSDFDRSIGHYRRYSKGQLVNRLKEAGFQVRMARYVDFPGILPWYLLMVCLKSGLSKGKVKTYDRFVVPVLRVVEGLVPPPIGKNLIAVGRKP